MTFFKVLDTGQVWAKWNVLSTLTLSSSVDAEHGDSGDLLVPQAGLQSRCAFCLSLETVCKVSEEPCSGTKVLLHLPKDHFTFFSSIQSGSIVYLRPQLQSFLGRTSLQEPLFF